VKPKCESCVELEARLIRLEKRFDRAEERAWHWHKRWQKEHAKVQRLEGLLSLKDARINELEEQVTHLKAQIAHLQKLAFGNKSEITPPSDASQLDLPEPTPKRKRGKQPGTKGFGRKSRHQLETVEVTHDVDAKDKLCCQCGAPRFLSDFVETSDEIDYEWKLLRVHHVRLKYKQTCSCPNTKTFVTAPPPVKLIPKGLFSTRFWTHVLVEKFLLQRPISKIALSLNLQGLDVSDGTLASGLKHLTKLFARVYKALRTESRRSVHWQMDETHWRVFVDLMGKDNHKWWLWVALTPTVCVFVLDPSRSSKVPSEHLKDIPAGILSCDRYSAYKSLQDGIELAYCWAHVRRDFLKLAAGYPSLKQLSKQWINRIDALFRTNKLRLNSRGTAAYDEHNASLTRQLATMHRALLRALRSQTVPQPAKDALSSLETHWTGLTIFRDKPDIPMDNNASERALRAPVVGRKNYYGAHSIWAGQLSAMMFSIFATLAKNRIDPYRWLSEYLNCCAQNGGAPPLDLADFLPWSMDPQRYENLRLAS
jgi:transposase